MITLVLMVLTMLGELRRFKGTARRLRAWCERKYLSSPVEEPQRVLLKTMDVEQLSNSSR